MSFCDETPEERQARLKTVFESGHYRPDSMEVAEAILARQMIETAFPLENAAPEKPSLTFTQRAELAKEAMQKTRAIDEAVGVTLEALESLRETAGEDYALLVTRDWIALTLRAREKKSEEAG